MTQVAIINALFTELSGVSGLPTILYPNVEYSTKPSEYIEAFILPTGEENEYMQGNTRQTGIMQINCVCEAGKGVVVANSYADIVKASFAVGTNLSGVKIMKPPNINPAIQDGSNYIVPIDIRYVIYN